MTHHVHFDMSEIDAAIERAKAAMEPIAAENSSRGAQARMSIAVDFPFSRQIAEEANRATPTELISDALACACSNMIGTFVNTVLQTDEPSPEHLAMVERQLLKIGRFMAQQLSGKSESIHRATVHSQRGGTA